MDVFLTNPTEGIFSIELQIAHFALLHQSFSPVCYFHLYKMHSVPKYHSETEKVNLKVRGKNNQSTACSHCNQ